MSKPTLDEELKTFKAIVRHITKYEIEPKTARWFTADNRPSLRRLGNLGINGASTYHSCVLQDDQRRNGKRLLMQS